MTFLVFDFPLSNLKYLQTYQIVGFVVAELFFSMDFLGFFG
jgi:hypothetical protein